jgi:soluble lytic murein transglycosylase-like protein
MQLEELSNISDNLAMMPDPALQQFAQMHKQDPYMVSLALSESNRRKKLRTAKQGQAGAMPQPKVVDSAIQGMTPAPAPVAQTRLPEDQGIAQIPAPNMQAMADGGIAGYGDGDDVPRQNGMAQGGMYDFAQRSEPVVRMAEGGIPGYKNGKDIKIYEDRIRAEAARQGVDPDLAVRMFITESGGKKDAVSPKGAAGLGQLMIPAAKEMGLTPAERFDPDKNIPASIGYLKKQLVKYNGDPEKALAAYNWGGGNVDKHLAKNEGRLNKVGLPKETADYLTKILPMGSARAEDVPQTGKPAPAQAKAAPAQPEVLTEKEIEALSKPAFLTPSSGKGRKEGKMSEAIKSGEAPRQMMLGAGDLPYNIAGGLFDISHDISKVFGNKSAPPALGSRGMKDFATKYLGREPDPTDPTLKGFRTAGELGSMVVDPMSTTRKVAKSAEGLEALAAAQRAKVAEVEAKAAQTQPLRIEPPSAPQTIVADMQGNAVLPTGLSAETRARQQLEAQDAAQKALADRAATGVEAGRLAQTERQLGEIPSLTRRAEMERLATMSDRARGTGLAAKVGDAETMRNLGIITERPEVGESVSGSYDTTMPPPKAIVEAAKEATPAKERKGFGDDDLLMLGLSLMANKSPNFMTALGEAGIQTLGAKREREKGETEKEYRAALIEQAKRPSNEVQLIEKYRDDPKFAEAYDKFVQSKRDPQSREALMKSWSNSIYLQSQYPNFEDYIKMVLPAGGSGALGSQLNASDQSLIQKYLR